MTDAGGFSPEAIAGYKAGARRRHAAEQQALAAREQRAWALARRAAAELRGRFDVERMVVFGLLVHPG